MNAVFCTVPSPVVAQAIIQELKAQGFSSQDISILFAKQGKMKALIRQRRNRAREGAATGAGAGGLIGGVLGWLAGIGILSLPGMGPFVAAGPVMSVLSAVALGGAVGGMLGALAGLGIPKFEIKKFERKLEVGDMFISVRAKTEVEMNLVKKIFQHAEAENITESLGEAA